LAPGYIYIYTNIHNIYTYIHIWCLARLRPACRASAHPSRVAPPGETGAWRLDMYIYTYIHTYVYIYIYIYGA